VTGDSLADLLVPTAQDRFALTDAFAQNGRHFDMDEFVLVAADFEPFNAEVPSFVAVTDAFGLCSGAQFSEILPAGVHATGGSTTDGNSSSATAFLDLDSESFLSVTFDVTAPANYTLIATLTSGGTGGAVALLLTGPGGVLVESYLTPSPGVVDVDSAGTLAPGSYTIIIDSQAHLLLVNEARYASTGYNVSFDLVAAPLAGDVNNDGEIAFDDLLAILSSWGPCASCAADLDQDGVVGFSDLLLVLTNWTA